MRQCRTCGNPEDDHPYRHPFVAETDHLSSDGLTQEQPKDSASTGHGNHPLPIDPVLRIALIDAGVISVEQLQAAQAKASITQQGVVISSQGGD